jgi:hypothetical protein
MTHVNGSDLYGKRFLKVFGNTYEHRAEIKKLGAASWSQAEGCWVISIGHLPRNQQAKIASATYALGKLGLSFEVEA